MSSVVDFNQAKQRRNEQDDALRSNINRVLELFAEDIAENGHCDNTTSIFRIHYLIDSEYGSLLTPKEKSDLAFMVNLEKGTILDKLEMEG